MLVIDRLRIKILFPRNDVDLIVSLVFVYLV